VGATGGDGTYSYSIDNGATFQASATFSSLGVDSYNLVVKDGKGCQSAAVAQAITEPAVVTGSLVAATSNVTLLCNGATNGIIDIIASGGDGAYEYSINGGTTFQSSANFSSLSAGSYSLVVKDGKGCQSAAVAQAITDPTAVVVTPTPQNPSCAGQNASVQIAVNGGSSGVYRYSLTGSAPWTAMSGTTATILNVSTNGQLITVEDGNSCQGSATITGVVLVNPITANPTPNHVTIPGGSNGSIAINSVAGGNGASIEYAIKNTTGTTIRNYNASLTGLPAGDYVVYARNLGQTCEYSLGLVSINQPDPIKGSAEAALVGCGVGAKGTITARVTEGGTEDFQLQLEKPDGTVVEPYGAAVHRSQDITFNNVDPGTYQVHILDVNGAEHWIENITIVPSYLSVEINAPDVACEGSQVTLIADVRGIGNKPRTYVWNDLPGTNSWGYSTTITKDQTFEVAVTAEGCTATAAHTVRMVPVPQIEMSPTATACVRYYLPDHEVSDLHGISDYDLTYHYQVPESATDKHHLIYSGDYELQKSQTVYVRMSVDDLCYDVAPLQVTVKSVLECDPIIVPKMFSPDDDGINDLFQISNIEEYHHFEVRIFNRFAKEMFKGNAEQIMPPYGWDGTYLGKKQPSGDYWYVITADELDKPIRGVVALKRGVEQK
jgi:gliding motility-associated-like protein